MKSVKALREVPSQAHLQGGCTAWRTRLVVCRVGQEYITPEGFLGDMYLGKPVWALGFEEHGMKAGFSSSPFLPPP